jgi:hypothetical protein
VRVLASHRPAGLLGLAAVAWLAGCAALVPAAGDLSRGLWYTPEALAASHLIGLGFMTTAIAGVLLHLAPTMSTARPAGGAVPGASVWAGALALALGLRWSWAAAEAAGGALLALGIGGLLVAIAGLWRGRRGSWPEPLWGLVASGAWLAAVLVAGLLAVAARRGDVIDVDRGRLIAVHAAMAILGWIGGLIIAMAVRMAPMMLVAPPGRLAVARAALVAWHLGVATLVAGLAAGRRPLGLAGVALLAVGVVALAAYLAGVVRRRRRRPPPAVRHLLAGLAALLAAAGLAVALPPARAAPVALLLALIGFGAGVTAGHMLVMVPTMCWVARFGGLRRGGGRPPGVAHLAPAWLAWSEAIAFAAGVSLVAAGMLERSEGATVAGAVALLAAAALLVGAVLVAALRPAPRWAPAIDRVTLGPPGGGRPPASHHHAPVDRQHLAGDEPGGAG